MQKADTTRAELQELGIKQLRISGLYVNYQGERITPTRIWFDCDLSGYFDNPKRNGGYAFYHYDNALRPVMHNDREQLRIENLRNVSADYDGANLTNFRIGD